jgi:hypothetical protein
MIKGFSWRARSAELAARALAKQDRKVPPFIPKRE